MNPAYFLGFQVHSSNPNYKVGPVTSTFAVPAAPAATIQIFEQLANAYVQATSWMSSPEQFRTTSAYRAIANLGDIAVPLILKRMQNTPVSEHWFPLLSQITGDDAVHGNHMGLVDRMTRDWLDWGHQRGLV